MEAVLNMILIASALFPPEPVVSANIAYDLACKLAEKHEVVVISPAPSRPYGMQFESLPTWSGFKHYQLESYVHPGSAVIGRFRESYSLGLHIKRFIELNHKNIEVVYANVWPLFAQLAVAKVCKKHDIPLVIHVQDIYPESLTNKIPFIGKVLRELILPVDKYILSAADLVVSISNQMKNELVTTRNITDNKVHVVRNWQNDDFFQDLKKDTTDSGVVNKDFTFLYLGSISPTAGVDLLISAFAKANLSQSKLVIAGGGSDKDKCIKLATLHNKNIDFIDAQPEQVASIQAQADILLLPLIKGVAATALPSKMTAYMLSGKPILASVDQPSEIASIIIDNQCGWVTAPGDIDMLSLAMQQAYSLDEEALNSCGANSLSFAKLNLSKKVNLNLLINNIENTKRTL